jgi:tetrahydromethanopterin S-methyltransferase subunit B
MTLTHEQRVKLATDAVKKRRDELINQPVMRIYDQLAEAAVVAYLAGDVVVPREPTRDMTMNACDRLPSCEHVFGHAGEICANVYRAMIGTPITRL